MPYKVFSDSDDSYCVHKLGADGSKGETVPGGCHPTKAEADAHARAMWASEAKDITDATLTLLKEITEDAADSKPERAAAVLDEWKARVGALPDEEEVSDAQTTEPTDTPEPNDPPVDEPEQEKPNKKSLLERLKEITEKVTAWFKPDDGAIGSGKDSSGMSIWKEGNTYWWMARYSNKFRDQDNPPEIIASESHKQFLARVKEGKAPLPELWLWHKKEWKVGQAHGLAYDELGFAVAIGTFDADKGNVAEALMKSNQQVRVSHGMPSYSIKRDTKDRTVIIEHETREISPLPAWAAANKLTGFVVLNLESKEDSMAIPDATKLEWIKTLGINPETLTSLEAANAADAAKAASEGLESKETEVSEVAQPATQDAPVSDPIETPAPVVEVPTVTLTVDALRTAVQEAVSGIVAPVMERMNTLEAGIKELKEANIVQAEVLKGTPTASLTALLGQFAQSAIGAPETRVDGRTSLAQSKPKEAARVDAHSPIPFINDMLSKQ
jgi:hypothetical protein